MSTSRDERQKLCVKKWIANKGKGTLIQPTGAGKSVTGLKCLKVVLNKFPQLRAIIVVPTDNLKEQWERHVDNWGFTFNVEVKVINSVIKSEWKTDILILDECHRYAADTFQQVFEKVHYKYVLGLTATFERLDGKQEIISKYCPVIDEITILEAELNDWISKYKEYLVLVDVPDIEEYKVVDKEFLEHYAFFNYNFDIILDCVGKNGHITCSKLRDEMCQGKATEEIRKQVFKQIKFRSQRAMKLVQLRKKFINHHPKKVELARKIIEARPFSKIVTFSSNVQIAESIGGGEVYTGKVSKKRGSGMIDRFNSGAINLLHSCAKLNEGADIKGLSVGIILGLDSSEIKAIQRRGRCIRFEEGKQAEIFNIVINDTKELAWFQKAHPNGNYTTIDESGLDDVLAGKEPKPYSRPIKNFTFRF